MLGRQVEQGLDIGDGVGQGLVDEGSHAFLEARRCQLQMV